jgi:hypothetical protein
VVTLALVAALGGVVMTRAWRVGRLAVTAVHEAGHAVMAILGGHTVTAVHLRPDSSGVTFHQGKQRWLSRVATAGAGYAAPGVAAIAGAALIAHGETRVWLTILLALGVVMVIGWVRNLFGVAVVGALVLSLGWLLVSGTSAETLLAGSIVTWYLGVGGLRAAVEQLRGDRGDAFELGRLLRLPAGLVRAGFVVVSAASLAACVALMFHW